MNFKTISKKSNFRFLFLEKDSSDYLNESCLGIKSSNTKLEAREVLNQAYVKHLNPLTVLFASFVML